MLAGMTVASERIWLEGRSDGAARKALWVNNWNAVPVSKTRKYGLMGKPDTS